MAKFLRDTGLAMSLLVMTGAAAGRAQTPILAGGDGMPVMSDTQAWCMHLAAEVDALQRALARPHIAADQLARQGLRLCRTGHVRLGITRLRYALMDLRER